VINITSRVTSIYKSYKQALEQSKERYELISKNRFENGKVFYEDFFHSLICKYDSIFSNTIKKARIKENINQIFNSDEVIFAAIDGTCYKKQLTDYVVFFGGSYAVRGSIKIMDENSLPHYEKWSSDYDTSFVTYVPIPYTELSQISREDEKELYNTVSDDEQRFNLANIHLQLMQLAEIFLAYGLAKQNYKRPNFILWDQSPSSILASTDVGINRISMIGGYFQGRKIQIEDAIIAYSKPWNESLNIPSFKNFRLYNRIIFELYKNNGKIELEEIRKKSNLSYAEFVKRIRNYLFQSKISDSFKGEDVIAKFDGTYITECGSISIKERWDYCVSLFETKCTHLFKDKKPEALIIEYKNQDGESYKRWITPNDLKFLISIGLRALIEECWKNNVLLVGIIKDSASRYLTRNYLNVTRTLKMYDFNKPSLPWTDRMYLESLPFIDDSLKAPWSSIEFDSIFSTLNAPENTENVELIHGVKGSVLTTENLFLRSLAQFYLLRTKEFPSTGHVIFIDRLAFPNRDRNTKELTFRNVNLGKVNPLFFKNCDTENKMQLVCMYLLTELTRNLFPEVIGYPDPLHKADWGAKSMMKKVSKIIESSELSLRINPLKKSFRDLRKEVRR